MLPEVLGIFLVCLGVSGGTFLKLLFCFCNVVTLNLTEVSKIFHSSCEILIGILGTISLFSWIVLGPSLGHL